MVVLADIRRWWDALFFCCRRVEGGAVWLDGGLQDVDKCASLWWVVHEVMGRR